MSQMLVFVEERSRDTTIFADNENSLTIAATILSIPRSVSELV